MGVWLTKQIDKLHLPVQVYRYLYGGIWPLKARSSLGF
jgi:hypothetical protein